MSGFDRFARKMDDDAGPLPAAQPVMMADAAQGSDLPPVPMALARELSAADGAPGPEDIFTNTRPENAGLAYLLLPSLSAVTLQHCTWTVRYGRERNPAARRWGHDWGRQRKVCRSP